MGEVVLVISGASGAIYGVRLADILGSDAELWLPNQVGLQCHTNVKD